jgi:glycosyltransferase involved in cell wall biosynthesis
MTPAPLRIVMIAPLRFPIRMPFAGGLESAVWNELRLLRSRGHHVEVIATEGSDFLDGPPEFTLPAVDWHGDPRAADDTYPDGYLERALPALGRALDVVAGRTPAPDVIVNHCLHGLPLTRAGSLGAPMLSTLHTPVVVDLVEAHARAEGRRSRFVSVSRHTRETWSGAGIPSDVLHNGVDDDTWTEGPGGDGLVWFGRINAEKAPHLALETALLLDRPLAIAGRIGDQAYFDREIAPRLDDRRRYVGPLATDELVALVGRSACSLVTPLWDEPFGLVTPEALLCGTPVAAFAAGGVVELAGGASSPSLDGIALAPIGDVAELARAAARLMAASDRDPAFRHRIREQAAARFTLRARVERLEVRLREAAAASAAVEATAAVDREPAA